MDPRQGFSKKPSNRLGQGQDSVQDLHCHQSNLHEQLLLSDQYFVNILRDES